MLKDIERLCLLRDTKENKEMNKRNRKIGKLVLIVGCVVE